MEGGFPFSLTHMYICVSRPFVFSSGLRHTLVGDGWSSTTGKGRLRVPLTDDSEMYVHITEVWFFP